MGKHTGPIEKKCKECGKTFLEVRSGRGFCSDACYDEWCRKRAPVTKACVVCGNEFTLCRSAMLKRQCCSNKCSVERATIHKKMVFTCGKCGKKFESKTERKFCSRECFAIDKSEFICPVCGKYKTRHNETCIKCRPPKIHGKCSICGRDLLKRGKIYCGSECAIIGSRSKSKEYICVCGHCGKEFNVDASHKHAKFCSKEFAWDHSRRLGGKKSMKRKYRTKINPSQRFRVLERDGYRCVYCGNTPNEARLVVDHIFPQSKLIKSAGNMDVNLVTACEICNSGKSDRKIERLPDAVKARISEYMIKEGYREGETVVQ